MHKTSLFYPFFSFLNPFISFFAADENGGAATGGGNDTTPPQGVSADVWNALGDPGKSALRKERKRATEAEKNNAALQKQVEQLQTQIDDMKNSDGNKNGSNNNGGNNGDNPAANLEELIAKAVTSATKPLIEAAKNKEMDEAIIAAASEFYNPKDVLLLIDRKKITDSAGEIDKELLQSNIEEIAKQRPYLLKPVQRGQSTFLGGKNSAPTVKERTEQALQRMQQATGLHMRKDK